MVIVDTPQNGNFDTDRVWLIRELQFNVQDIPNFKLSLCAE